MARTKKGQSKPRIKRADMSESGAEFARFKLFARRLVKNNMEGAAKRRSPTAGMFLAGFLDSIISDVIERAANSARDRKKKRISTRDILFAVSADDVCRKLFDCSAISSGGVVPNIHEELIPKKSLKKTLSVKDVKKAPKRHYKKKTTKKPTAFQAKVKQVQKKIDAQKKAK